MEEMWRNIGNTGPTNHRTLLYKTEEYQRMGRGNFVHKRNRQEMCVCVGGWVSWQRQVTVAYYSPHIFTKIDLVFYIGWQLPKVFIYFLILVRFVFSYAINKRQYAAQHHTTSLHKALHVSVRMNYNQALLLTTIYLLTYLLFTYLLISLLTYLLTYLLIYLLTYLFTYLLIYLLTYLLIYLLTYSMEHSPSLEANWFCS